MNLKDIDFEDINWLSLVYDGVKLRSLVNMMSLWVPHRTGPTYVGGPGRLTIWCPSN
jgi:hypothetical protein